MLNDKINIVKRSLKRKPLNLKNVIYIPHLAHRPCVRFTWCFSQVRDDLSQRLRDLTTVLSAHLTLYLRDVSVKCTECSHTSAP